MAIARENQAEIKETQYNLHQGRGWGCKADVKNTGPILATDPKAQGKPHTEGTHDTLEHDKHGTAGSVKKADEAEEKGGKETINGVGFQIFPACSHNGAVACEKACQKISMKKIQPGHQNTHCKRSGDTI